MGNNLFGANISGALNAGLASKLKPLTLRKNVMSPRDLSNPGAGRTATPQDTKGRGFMETKIQQQPATVGSGSNPPAVSVTNNTISILGDSLKGGKIAPAVEDQILFAGQWYTIKSIGGDPDLALYDCVCS